MTGIKSAKINELSSLIGAIGQKFVQNSSSRKRRISAGFELVVSISDRANQIASRHGSPGASLSAKTAAGGVRDATGIVEMLSGAYAGPLTS